MSKRTAGQAPPDNSTSGSYGGRPAEGSGPRLQSAGTRVTPSLSAASSPAPPRSGRPFELPPLPTAPSSLGGSFPQPPSRLAGVSSILNPTSDEGPQGRRRKASELDSPPTALAPLAIGSQASRQSLGQVAASPGQYPRNITEQQPRRILTPRSPQMHRAASLNQLNVTTGSISARNTPFPGSPQARTYAMEPGTSGAPPLPTPPALARHGFGFGPTPSAEAARRANAGVNRSGFNSASASPTTSYSSYGQAEQTSPSAQYGPLTSLNAPLAGGREGSGGSSALANASGQERQRPAGIPISSSSGQNVYQMMTLETTSGTVQLPVDVQAASRVADEKRRRNAGASARFRQRRKEKEKEASVTISRLEQQVKELSEDADFYKHERDYMAGLLIHLPGGERHFPRPASPRRRRSSTTLQGPGPAAGAGYGSISQESSARSPIQSRNVRRRTSTASLPPPPPAGVAHQGSQYQQQYASQQFGTPIAPQPRPGLPQAQGAMQSPMAQPGASHPPPLPPMQQQPGPAPHQLPTQLMQAPPQTGPWNPYAPAPRRALGPPGRSDDSRDAR